MKNETVTGNSRSPGQEQLTTGGHVELKALLVGEAGHRRTEECLRGVGHPSTEGGNRLSAPGPQVILVVDKQGGSPLVGQVD